MASFSYNIYSGISRMNQYQEYIQNQNYVTQIDKAIRETGDLNAKIIAIQSREVQNAIRVSSQEQRDAIIQARDAICATLETGFGEVNDNLYGIRDDIDRLSRLVGYGFSIVLEQQKITNKYLGQIEKILRIPDSQKQRVYHINEGMKYLQNAFKQSAASDFYADA